LGPLFYLGSIIVIFVVDKVPLGHVFLLLLRLSIASTVPKMPHTHLVVLVIFLEEQAEEVWEPQKTGLSDVGRNIQKCTLTFSLFKGLYSL
jgi:hypothetical protein